MDTFSVETDRAEEVKEETFTISEELLVLILILLPLLAIVIVLFVIQYFVKKRRLQIDPENVRKQLAIFIKV